jgi:predicted nucleic acid-binding protein
LSIPLVGSSTWQCSQGRPLRLISRISGDSGPSFHRGLRDIQKDLREQADLVDQFLSQAFGFYDRLIPLTLELAVLSSKTSLHTGSPMADAIIYATATRIGAQLITSDSHFANLPGVTVV